MITGIYWKSGLRGRVHFSCHTVSFTLRNGVIINLLYLDHEEIVKLHLRDLHQEAERCRVAQQVLAAKKELPKSNHQVRSTTIERHSERHPILEQIFNIGRRML